MNDGLNAGDIAQVYESNFISYKKLADILNQKPAYENPTHFYIGYISS